MWPTRCRPSGLGHPVGCRVEVDTDILEITTPNTALVRHRLSPGATEPVWDPAHRAAAEAMALGRSRPTLRLVTPPAEPASSGPGRLELGGGDYDVEGLDLGARCGGCGCPGEGA